MDTQQNILIPLDVDICAVTRMVGRFEFICINLKRKCTLRYAGLVDKEHYRHHMVNRWPYREVEALPDN